MKLWVQTDATHLFTEITCAKIFKTVVSMLFIPLWCYSACITSTICMSKTLYFPQTDSV